MTTDHAMHDRVRADCDDCQNGLADHYEQRAEIDWDERGSR